MATVHFGRLIGPVGFSRTVAIKRLHPQYAKDPEFVAMFLDEARLAARIRHPNVLGTLDVVATDGELFLVMEYVHGESLGRLTRRRPAPPRIVAAIMTGVLHGLHAAHEARNERGEPLNIVHRDISPQNILVGTDGTARVLDFGVAKATGRSHSTREGHIKGKIAYMAPEQFRGAASRRTDIYSAAIVIWEALTGSRLFAGLDEAETIAKAIAGIAPPPSSVHRSVPAALDEFVMKALAVDPTKRFETAREMAVALERCVGLASPSEVGEWVDELAGAALEKRAEQVAEIEAAVSPVQESSSTSPPPSLDTTRVSGLRDAAAGLTPRSVRVVPPPPSEPSGVLVGPTAMHPVPPRAPSHRWALPLAVATAAAALLYAFAPHLRSPSAASAKDAEVTLTAPPTPSASVQAPPAEPSSLPEPAPSASAALASSSVSAKRALPQPGKAKATLPSLAKPDAPKAQETTLPAEAPKPRTDCDPPFSIDAAGHKHYKPECL
jgi:serine/threonine-protein kinase